MVNVQVTDFGKDHWSLLAYVETLCVDSTNPGVGEVDKRRLRCNPNTHPFHAVGVYGAPRGWEPSYGTRLAGFWRDDKTTDQNKQITEHDDWDCLNDLEAAGFVDVVSEVNGFVRITDLGLNVAARLRAHKARGGYFADFKEVEV